MSRVINRVVPVLFALAAATIATPADATVKRAGQWPAHEENVSLDLRDVSRAKAIRELADEAGWSLVLHAPSDERVTIIVEDQPPSKVLESILSDADYVATRDGTLVSIEPGGATKDAAAAAPEVAAPTETRGSDRTVSGSNVTIAKGEVVHDVTVSGGSVEISGLVTGDVFVVGGTVTVRPGGHVVGYVSAIGGAVNVDEGGIVDGEIDAVGGAVKRGDKVVGSHVGVSHAPKSTVETIAQRVGNVFTNIALLFALGAVCIALMRGRMDTLRVEIAARPMRTAALGALGFLGGLVIFIALCITVIGIPVALVLLLLSIFGTFAGICAVASVGGEALLKHKTSNIYVHLAFGCAVYVLALQIPYVGDVIGFGMACLGFGVLVATRGAGFVKRRLPAADPYRSPAI